MAIHNFTKDPTAILDYSIDWSDWLLEDTILTSNFTVGAGLTVDLSTNTTTSTTVWLSGGTIGFTYNVVNKITTAGGRQDSRTFTVTIEKK
jgi:hypothetical protein